MLTIDHDEAHEIISELALEAMDDCGDTLNAFAVLFAASFHVLSASQGDKLAIDIMRDIVIAMELHEDLSMLDIVHGIFSRKG